jgi:hypothetical protein
MTREVSGRTLSKSQRKQLRQSEEWKVRIAVAHAELRPTAEELGDILRDARRRGEQLKEELAG